MYVHTYKRTYVPTYHTYVCIYPYKRTYLSIQMYIYSYIPYIRMYTYKCTYLCTYIMYMKLLPMNIHYVSMIYFMPPRCNVTHTHACSCRLKSVCRQTVLLQKAKCTHPPGNVLMCIVLTCKCLSTCIIWYMCTAREQGHMRACMRVFICNLICNQ